MGTQQRSSQVDFNMTPKSAMYGSAEHWVSSPQTDHSYTVPDYTDFHVDNTRQSSNPFTLQEDFDLSEPNHHDAYGKHVSDGLINGLKTQSAMNMYPTTAAFTASNAQRNLYNATTVSPLNTNFNLEQESPLSNTKPSFGKSGYAFASSDYAAFNDDADTLSSKHRCDSLHSNTDSPSSQSKVGRRRGSEYAEPGSARAIYLEKNRKAASKCRSKQKRQQDELVETARDVERRNRILKAEVEILKSGMRELMEIVGQHTECPDARLKLYVQREADRLVSQSGKNPVSAPASARSSSGPAYGDMTSSPGED